MANKDTAFSLNRLITTLIVFYVLGFIGFFVHSLLSFDDSAVLRTFYSEWSYNSAILRLIDVIIPIQCSAILVAYSYLAPRNKSMVTDAGNPLSFTQFVSSGLILVLVLALVFTILSEAYRPAVSSRLNDITNLTKIAKKFEDRGRTAFEEKRYGDSVSNYNLYLSIDPNNAIVSAKLTEAMGEYNALDQSQDNTTQAFQSRNTLLKLDPIVLTEKAQGYFDSEDFFSAHYYFTLAYDIDPAVVEANRMASKSWDKIIEIRESKKDKAEFDLFSKKTTAYKVYIDGNPVQAYYLFSELAEEYPGDPDIQKYLANSKARALLETYSLNEAERVLPLPGTTDIMFLNVAEAGYREILHAGKYIAVTEGIFLQDLDAVGFAPGLGLEYQLKAEKAKLMVIPKPRVRDTKQSLETLQDREHVTALLVGIDEEDDSKSEGPLYLAGRRTGELANQLAIEPDSRDIPYLSFGANLEDRSGIAELWRMQKVRAAYGLRPETAQVALLIRILLPFSFLTFSFASLALGWATRYRNKKPGLFAWLFVPVLPLSIYLIFEGYIYIHHIALGTLVLSFGFWAGAIGLVVTQSIAFVASLLFLAVQSPR